MAKTIDKDERILPPWEFIYKVIKIHCEESNESIEAKISAYDPEPLNQLDVFVDIPDLTKSYHAQIGNCCIPMYWNKNLDGWEGTLEQPTHLRNIFSVGEIF